MTTHQWNNHFAVGVRLKVIVREFGAQIKVVIDFAVDAERDFTVLAGDWLRARDCK